MCVCVHIFIFMYIYLFSDKDLNFEKTYHSTLRRRGRSRII